MNSLNKIFTAMRKGEYGSIVDTKGGVHIGLINSITREDGSGKNWLVSISHQLHTTTVFIHAS